MLVHTEKLLGKLILLNTVMVIKARLCAPAYMQCRGNIALGPLHNATQLVPILDISKLKKLNGGTGNNKSVVFVLLNMVKRIVKRLHMACGCVFGYVACRMEERNLNLQRRITEKSEKLRLSNNFRRH